jgi:hypothetical protein
MKRYMGPYKGKLYHLLDFRRGSQPRDMHKIFNHAHSYLDALLKEHLEFEKNKWKLLHCKQVKIVVASMALHNFIRKHAIKDAEFQPYDDDRDLLPTDNISDNKTQDESSIQQSDTSNENSMNIERDHIANLLMTR